MTAPSPALPRHLRTTLALPVVLVLGACGISYDAVIKDDDTVTITAVEWGNQVAREICTADNPDSPITRIGLDVEEKASFTQRDGTPACEYTATDIPLSTFEGNQKVNIDHADGVYTVDLAPGGSQSDLNAFDIDLSISVTFPGRITQATGSSVDAEGNTVTWSDLSKESGALHAVGEDSSGPSWLLVGFGIVGAAAVLAVIAFVVWRKRGGGHTPGTTPDDGDGRTRAQG